MNMFDIIIAVFVLVIVAIGFNRGFIREVQSLGIWIISVGLAWFFAPDMGKLFSGIDSRSMRVVTGFTVLFIAIYFLGSAILRMINKNVRTNAWLKMPNHIMGAAMGFARALFIVIIIVLLVGLTALPQRDFWQQSRFAPLLADLALASARFLPRDVSRHIRYN